MRVGAAIVLCLTGLFLLVGSRERPWGDARIMYEVAENVVDRGEITVATEWPPMSHVGEGGAVYAQYALGASLVHVPGVIVRDLVTAAAPGSASLALVVTSHLASALLAALTCAMFFAIVRRLGVGVRAASLATIALALGTMLLVYARSPYSEALQAACFTGLLGEALRVDEAAGRRRALAFGAWAGALINAKAVLALSVIGALIHVVVVLRRDRAALARYLGWAAIGAAPLAAAALAYNRVRWGSAFDTGYGETLGLMREHLLQGLWGFIASPGKSLFLFSPPLLAGIIGLPRLAREHRRAALALALLAGPPLLFYACFLHWPGDYAWGPRYLTFVVPALMVPAALWLEPVVSRAGRRVARGAAIALLAAGIAVQLLGSAFYWDHWIRVAGWVRQAWLGDPDRSGALIAEADRGHCDSCFEDMYAHQWLPPFSPIAGHYWLLRHVPFDDPWEIAERDAPWRRHTTLSFPPVAEVYQMARLDWWGFVWLDDEPDSRPLGLGLLVVFSEMTAAGAWLWRRRGRA